MISSSLSRGLLTIIIGSLCITSVCASGVRHTQSGWTAHPPLHVLRASDAAPVGYAPAQIRHAYGFDAVAAAGSGQIIAIVDAYDAPKVASDLQTFTATFRLHPLFGLPGTSSCSVITGPHPCFQEVFAQGKKPAADDGWALETALDTQWAHATAPAADILLVETQSASLTSLMGGVEAAVANKARVVSMSWGGDEFAAEANYDSHFHKPGISFLASSGDNGNGVSYPASSPYVLSVGGTTLTLDAAGALIKTEKGWQGSGGGISAYEKQPSYQSFLSLSTGGMRATPDISADADPQTGVAVYHAGSGGGWYTVGGTSASAPQWAGIVAVADSLRSLSLATSAKDQSFLYSAAIKPGNFRDIKSGKNGTCGVYCRAAAGFDLVTGLGSPLLPSLIPALAAKK